MTWLLGLMASFVYLGMRRRPPGVSVHLKAFMVILAGVLYEAFKLHLI